MMTGLRHSLNGLLFVGFLKARIEPMVVILDNASIDTVKALAAYGGPLEENGICIFFLPTYCRDLSRFEIL